MNRNNESLTPLASQEMYSDLSPSPAKPSQESVTQREVAALVVASAESGVAASPTPQRASQFRLAGYQETSDSPAWDTVLVTMIYTHCVPVRTIQEPESPLDL